MLVRLGCNASMRSLNAAILSSGVSVIISVNFSTPDANRIRPIVALSALAPLPTFSKNNLIRSPRVSQAPANPRATFSDTPLTWLLSTSKITP